MRSRSWPLAALVIFLGGVSVLLAGCEKPPTPAERAASETDLWTTTKTTDNDDAFPAGAIAEAHEMASKEGKYLFVFFWKAEDADTTAMRKLFDETMAQVADRASTATVDITDAAETGFVEGYGLKTAPMPLVMAIAPNGAITGGLPAPFSKEDLLSAFATPATADCLKQLQGGKLVFLCVQNGQTGMNDEAMRGVEAFASDVLFRNKVQLVSLDPSDSAEAAFLNDLKINPATTVATTVFLVPPGAPIAIFEGATTKDQILAELQKAGSCGPGGACGPGGCGPR